MAPMTQPPTVKSAGRKSRRLRVHVLGAGKGESLVLELPDGKWGVVDCYARHLADPSANPTVRFLREHGVTALEFLCLTHPHDDHFRGMSHLLECFEVSQFWRFGSWSRQQLKDLLDDIAAEAQLSGGSEKEASDDLRRTLGAVAARQASGTLTVTGLSDVKSLYRSRLGGGAEIRIYSLAPATALAEG